MIDNKLLAQVHIHIAIHTQIYIQSSYPPVIGHNHAVKCIIYMHEGPKSTSWSNHNIKGTIGRTYFIFISSNQSTISYLKRHVIWLYRNTQPLTLNRIVSRRNRRCGALDTMTRRSYQLPLWSFGSQRPQCLLRTSLSYSHSH